MGSVAGSDGKEEKETSADGAEEADSSGVRPPAVAAAEKEASVGSGPRRRSSAGGRENLLRFPTNKCWGDRSYLL